MNDKKYKILIVDDEEDIREVLAEMLEIEGYSCKSAVSGNEAFELIGHEQFDLVLSDVRMPNGDGVSLLRKVKEELSSDIPIVLITGFSEISASEAIEKGAETLLMKPVDMSTLVAMIEKVREKKNLAKN